MLTSIGVGGQSVEQLDSSVSFPASPRAAYRSDPIRSDSIRFELIRFELSSKQRKRTCCCCYMVGGCCCCVTVSRVATLRVPPIESPLASISGLLVSVCPPVELVTAASCRATSSTGSRLPLDKQHQVTSNYSLGRPFE